LLGSSPFQWISPVGETKPDDIESESTETFRKYLGIFFVREIGLEGEIRPPETQTFPQRIGENVPNCPHMPIRANRLVSPGRCPDLRQRCTFRHKQKKFRGSQHSGHVQKKIQKPREKIDFKEDMENLLRE